MGKIYFLLVRIKIKHMELSIIRRETTGAGKSTSPTRHVFALTPSSVAPNQYNESETITKFEIMDGAPVRGTFLPRIQLSQLTTVTTVTTVLQARQYPSDCSWEASS